MGHAIADPCLKYTEEKAKTARPKGLVHERVGS
jgi:hypothetical protein